MPVNAENPNQLPRIPIRGHHLDLISDIVLDKKEVFGTSRKRLPVGITPENLYRFPMEGSIFVRSLVQSELSFYTGMYYGSTEDEDKVVEDYLGPKMSKKAYYEQATLVVFSDIFQSDPNRMVEVTIQPDGFCLACQSTPQREPGKHCHELPSMLDKQSIDAVNFAIDGVLLSNSLAIRENFEHGMLMMEVTDKMTLVPVGLLRHRNFQSDYSQRIKKQRK